MSVITYDTHAFIKELEYAGYSKKQAEAQCVAISRVLNQIEESRLAELATKRDIKELEVEIVKAKTELEGKIVTVKTDLEVKIAATKTQTIKWVVGMLIVQAGILIGGFFTIIQVLLKP